MIYCRTYETWREAQYCFYEFVKENEKGLIEASRVNLRTLDKEGNLHCFITFEAYPKWCLGKTYIWNGKMYRSGMRVRGEK